MRRTFIALAFAAAPALLFAVSLPHTFSNGAVASADDVNENFDAVKTALEQRDGSSPAKAAASCTALKTLGYPSGRYWLDATPGTPAGAFEAYCEQDLDGGGWMLAVQGIPVVNAAATLCTDAAVGDLTLDSKTVLAPARLSRETIEAFWSAERELLVTTAYDTTGTTRSSWSDVCVLDFEDGIRFPSGTGATVNPALGSTVARCGLPGPEVTVTIQAYSEPVSCGFSFRNAAQTRYFMFSAVPSFGSGTCGSTNAGRNWAGSGGNNGCNVARWFVR